MSTIRKIRFRILVIGCIIFAFIGIKAQDHNKHFSQGVPVLVLKKEFKDYTIRIPDSVDISIKNEQLIIKLVSTPDFAAILVVKYYGKKAESDLKELFKKTIDLNDKHSIWNKNKIYTFKPEELSKGNAAQGYLVNGHSTDKLPMKVYNLLGVLENTDKKKMLIFSGSISVNPAHKNYKDFDEIRKYMNDFKTIMISTEFKD